MLVDYIGYINELFLSLCIFWTHTNAPPCFDFFQFPFVQYTFPKVLAYTLIILLHVFIIIFKNSLGLKKKKICHRNKHSRSQLSHCQPYLQPPHLSIHNFILQLRLNVPLHHLLLVSHPTDLPWCELDSFSLSAPFFASGASISVFAVLWFRRAAFT